MKTLACVNTLCGYDPRDLKSPTVASFPLTIRGIKHTDWIILRSLLFIKGSIQIQQSKVLVYIKFPRAYTSLVSFHVTFVQMELSQRIMHNASPRDKERSCTVVRAQTWVRANMVLYWLPATGTFSTGLEICGYSLKNMHSTFIDSKALCTAHSWYYISGWGVAKHQALSDLKTMLKLEKRNMKLTWNSLQFN